MVAATVGSIGERGFLRRSAKQLKAAHLPSGWRLEVGIGDDTAVLQTPGRSRLLFASDMLVEDVHFRRGSLPPQWIGWKALARNISDIAAMGGIPVAAVVSLGLPAATALREIDGISAGLQRCARRFGMAVVGGDTVRSPRLVIDVAILGQADRSRLPLRGGARPGDAVFVTGRLGGSYLSGKHARFIPRLAEARELLRRAPLNAMIDLSDGLASGLWSVAEASHAILRIEAGRVPVSRAGKTLAHALNDGEDFELLFTVPSKAVARIPHVIGRCPITRIGSVHQGKASVRLAFGGKERVLKTKGFEHF